MKNFKRFTRNRHLLFLDLIIAILVYIFTKLFLNTNVHTFADIFTVKTNFDNYDILYLIFTILIYLLAITLSKSQQVMWLYAGTKNYLQLIMSVIAFSIINTFMSAMFFTGERFAILFNMTFFLWVICSRMAIRGIAKIIKNQTKRQKTTKTESS